MSSGIRKSAFPGQPGRVKIEMCEREHKINAVRHDLIKIIAESKELIVKAENGTILWHCFKYDLLIFMIDELKQAIYKLRRLTTPS